MQGGQLSTSGQNVKDDQQQDCQDRPAKSYQCSQCTDAFKAKVYLFEHLNKVHGFSVDEALIKAGLKHLITGNANVDNKSSNSENNFKCQHCDFKSSTQEVLKDHGKQCSGKTRAPNFTPSPGVSETLDVRAVRANGYSKNAKSEGTPSPARVGSVPQFEIKSISKDLKTYKRSPSTIIKYLVVPKSKSGSSKKSGISEKTTILQEPPSSFSSRRKGTAKGMIDVTNHSSCAFLQNDPLLCDKLKQPKVKNEIKNPVHETTRKRICDNQSESSPAKKRKTGKEEDTKTASDSPNRVELSFEFSEDESEKKEYVVNEDETVYFCKHCDYSQKTLKNLSSHYKINHPYVKANLVYIRDSWDKSATFRCLECPVEFAAAAALKRHYKKSHPEAPDVFTLKPSAFDLMYKCFLCAFDCISLKTLKEHYGEKHPEHKRNSLLFCRYSVTACQKELSQLDQCEKAFMVEASAEISPETTGTPSNYDKTPLPQHHSSKGESEPLYKCIDCVFNHKSVVVMHVHYQKSHPETAMTIDKIKQSARLTSQLLSPMTPEKSANSTASMGPSPQRSVPDLTRKRKDMAEVSPSTNLQHSIGKKKTKKRAKSSGNPTSSHSEISQHRQSQNGIVDSSFPKYKAYEHAENLFYCSECNFGNPHLKGIQTHQRLKHSKVCDGNPECIIKYSTLVCEKIKKSKSEPKEFPFSTGLPHPLLKKGDECMLFCHFCNYKHRNYETVYKHYTKTHSGWKVTPEQIELYNSIVHKQKPRPSLKATPDQEVNQNFLMENRKQKVKKFSQSLSDSARFSKKATAAPRNIQCYKCNYTSQYVFLLKSHIFRVHQTKQSVTEILKEGFKQGALQSGYHCELCVSTHKKPTTLYKHYQEHHPGRKLSFKYVSTQLYVGPQTSPRKKKEPESKSIDLSGSVDEGTNKPNSNSSPCPESNTDMDHLYTRKAKFPDKAKTSVTEYKCPYCSLVANSQHNLETHCRIKHPEASTKLHKEVPPNSRVHVFKCPYCTYVNTTYQGILAHCQKKHPSRKSRVESLHVDLKKVESFNNESAIGGSLQFKGFMCETCLLICVTREKLLKHCESKHSEMDSSKQNKLKAVATKSSSSRSLRFKGQDLQMQVKSKVSLLENDMYNSLECQFCAGVFTSRKALNRHLCTQHKDAFPKGDLFECKLCPIAYLNQRALDRHVLIKHGKVRDLKSDDVFDQISQEQSPRSPHNQNTSVISKSDSKAAKLLVFRCPLCPYVNSGLNGIFTHCQMRHPKVVVKPTDLKMDEIVATDMVRISSGKSPNWKGYTCTTCPNIYATLPKLITHCERGHSEAAPLDHSVKSEDEDVDVSSRVKVSEVNDTRLEHSYHSISPKTNQSNHESMHTKGFKCHLCSYEGAHRRYLYSHYRKTHRLDEHSTSEVLQKYKRERLKKKMTLPEPLEPLSNRCVKCPDLIFDSHELLVNHYSTFHLSAWKMDFVVLSTGTKKGSTGLYRCSHCHMQLKGTKKLSYHLHLHRERKKEEAKRQSLLLIPKIEPNSIQLCRQDELSMPHAMEPFNQQVDSLTSHLKSPLKVGSSEQLMTKPTGNNHPCAHCGRTFMSLKGLASHRRSHAAFKAIKKMSNLPKTSLKTEIAKYIVFKSGTTRPFRCTLCSYRTTVMGLCCSHFLKKHPGVVLAPPTDENDPENTESLDIELPQKTSGHFNAWDESDESHEESKSYFEPQDVQQQINYYHFTARHRAAKDANVEESNRHDENLIYCDMCNFCSEHMSSLRRHYLNRHGKRALKCKDCDFITGSRKTFEMHVKNGHNTFQPGLPHQKAFRCPFCLYQTKNKNMMIDHIVLHREERVIPIEVRRSKLSRYLENVVFRCHECTFTCGTKENLKSHMTRHNAVKPYKCRLCFFDCTELSDLEAHLSDKHQVVRNHELVGQVSLDQLEVNGDETTEMEEDSPLTSEPRNNDEEETHTEATVCNSVLDGQTEQLDHEEDPQRPDGSQREEEEEEKDERGRNVEMDLEESSSLEKEKSIPDEYSGCDDDTSTVTPLKDKAMKSISSFRMKKKIQSDIEERFEEDILRNILLLDEDGSNYKKTAPDRKGRSISPCPDEKLLTCDLCGRNFNSSSELECHALRHGM